MSSANKQPGATAAAERPIVGVGASAGGRDVGEQHVRACPGDRNMASSVGPRRLRSAMHEAERRILAAST